MTYHRIGWMWRAPTGHYFDADLHRELSFQMFGTRDVVFNETSNILVWLIGGGRLLEVLTPRGEVR